MPRLISKKKNLLVPKIALAKPIAHGNSFDN